VNVLSHHNQIARRTIAERLKSAESRLVTVQTVLYNVLARHGAQEFTVADLRIPQGCIVKCDTPGDGTVRFSATAPEASGGAMPFKMEFVGNESESKEGTTNGEEAAEQGGGVEAGVKEVGGGDAQA
jgi:hypothetical protein